jgi:hypothetical protein
MDNLVLLFKSHRPHLAHTQQLVETAMKHNKDGLPIFVSVPKQELSLFESTLGTVGFTFITDEDVLQGDQPQSWITQQLVKMKFSEMGLCHNYLWVDGDSYFIRDFSTNDFMYTDTIPYTTIHENKDLFQWMATKGNLLENVLGSYKEDRDKVRTLFGRQGKYFDWTCPNLWSVKVFDHMKEYYLTPNNLTFQSLLEYVPGELVWYGEYLLAAQPIPIIPCESWFKPFHYLQQMIDCKNQGNTEQSLAKNFLGIVMPSKETNQLRF